MISRLGTALARKIRDASGRKSVVDNTKNPASAHSMVMRKTANKALENSFESGGKQVLYRNDRQKRGY